MNREYLIVAGVAINVMFRICVVSSSLFLCMLDTHAYGETPSSDISAFSNGNTKTFNTDGHRKAGDIKLSLKYPSSWIASEGDRPHIVQRFQSESARVLQSAIIFISDSGPGLAETTNEEKEAFFDSEELAKVFMPQGAKLNSSVATKIESMPAGLLDYSLEHERVGFKAKMRSLTLVFLWKSHVIQISCSTTVLSTQPENVDHEFNSYKPVFQLLMANVVLKNRWVAEQPQSPKP